MTPTPNPHEYPIRVNSRIIRSFNEDPRYTVLPIRFINNSSLSNPRKQRITKVTRRPINIKIRS